MNVEELRDYCLSLPHATEKMPFQKFESAKNIIAFYIGEHIFCFFDIVKFDEATLRADPDKIPELKAEYSAIGKPFNFSPKDWIGVKLNGDVNDKTLKELIKESYEIVAKE